MKILFNKSEEAGDIFGDAEKDVAKDLGLNEDGTKKESFKEGDKKEDEKHDEEKETDLNEEQLAHAKTLFKLLNDPERSKETIEVLARAAGIKMGEIETKKEETKAIKSIKEMIEEEMGDEYKFFGSKLGNAIEKVLKHAIDENTKDLRESTQNLTNTQIKSEAIKVQNEVLGEYAQVPAQVLREMLRIQKDEEVSLGPKGNYKTFFKTCLNLAAENCGISLIKKGNSKTDDNKGEKKKSSPIDALNNRGSQKEGKKDVQIKSYKDAIELAIEEVESKMK